MSYTHKRMGYSQKNTKEFEPQLGNLYRLEKPNSKITKTHNNYDQSRLLTDVADRFRQIQKWFGSSELGKSLMATKDRLSNLDQLHFYTDGSLKKHHYRTIQDGNAILNNRVVKENNLDLNLHKVKGHSGNLWNDKVDELAKQASSSTSASNIVQFNQGHDGLNFVPMINEVPVEQKLRKFVKNVMNFVNDGQWSQLSCNQDALLDRTKDYDWDITWNALKQVKHFKCTSSKHNKL
ncbi:unnamed protein product [Rhizophagus irregularis]|nr:unnamed protein product [Rhizophagus irregularis]